MAKLTKNTNGQTQVQFSIQTEPTRNEVVEGGIGRKP